MKILSFLVFFVLAAGYVQAQETQVPFDSSGKVMVIDQDLEKKLDLFPSFPHFLEARLYREPDSSYVLEVTSFENAELVKDRLPKSANAMKLLREDVDSRLGPQVPKLKLDQSSRSKFVIWETILSIAGYGPAIISSLSPNNGGVGSGIELVIGGSGYLLSSLLTENAPMTDGDASLALGGAFLGAAHGILIDEMLSNGNAGSEIGVFSAITSIAETGIGYAIASKNNMSEGTADIVRYGGLFGMVDGAGLALAINNAPSATFGTGMSLLGSAAGFVAGTVMANNQPYSRGNASTVLTAGIFGAYIPSALYASAISYNTSNNPTTGLALAGVAGNVGGVLLANSLMKDRHFSTAEGTAVILGTSAGLLIGTGIGYIIVFSSNNQFNVSPWAFTLPSVIGTAVGFGVTIATIGKGTGDRSTTGWNFDANPGALMGALIPQHKTNSHFVTPIASASYRF